MAALLKKFGFAGSLLVAREQGEWYCDVVEKLLPDVLIEETTAVSAARGRCALRK